MFARDCWCEVEGGPSVHFIEENDSDFMHLKVMHSFDILDIEE